MMDELLETIKKADNGDIQAQYEAAWKIVYGHPDEKLEPDLADRAVKYFESAVAHGNGNAMLDLAVMYLDGIGVEQNFDRGIALYKQAAQILHPKAFRCLAYALAAPEGCLNGDIYNTDFRKAFRLFLPGALMREPNALYEIADLYMTGRYVPQLPELAFELYEESSTEIEFIEDDSYANVCYRLGFCFATGRGTEQDLSEAREYLEASLEGFAYRIKQHDDKRFFMADYNKTKFLLKRMKDTAPEKLCSLYAEEYTPVEIEKDEMEKAFVELATTALDTMDENPTVLRQLEEFYRQGLVTEKNVEFADWLEKAADV